MATTLALCVSTTYERASCFSIKRPFLFNATIAENVGFAWPDATLQAIEEAGRAAGLNELIDRLPEGWATQTGERGLALSAGERQRIALARALLGRPDVLILDEPTFALDAKTETGNRRRPSPRIAEQYDPHSESIDAVVVPAMGKVEADLAATNPGPSLFHCHQQFHMDFGFMALMQYEG